MNAKEEKMKHSWETPKLVTLYRGSPEEIATPSDNCKHLTLDAILPTGANTNCNAEILDPMNACGKCQNNANRS